MLLNLNNAFYTCTVEGWKRFQSFSSFPFGRAKLIWKRSCWRNTFIAFSVKWKRNFWKRIRVDGALDYLRPLSISSIPFGVWDPTKEDLPTCCDASVLTLQENGYSMWPMVARSCECQRKNRSCGYKHKWFKFILLEYTKHYPEVQWSKGARHWGAVGQTVLLLWLHEGTDGIW